MGMIRIVALLLLGLTACSTATTNTPPPIGCAQEPPEDMPPPMGAIAPPEPSIIPDYDRSDWHTRWYDLDKDCQDTRQEVLIAESTTPPVMDDRGCRVVSGTWEDPYTGKTFTNPSDLDIDHFIPLRNAHTSGGWMWDRERRKAFANDLDDPEALIAVDLSANRSKGARGPDEWLPPNQDYVCEYVTTWLDVKERNGLTLTADEARAIANLDCPSPP